MPALPPEPAIPPRPSVARAALILRELSWEPPADPVWWESAAAGTQIVRRLPRERPTWSAGEAVVTVFDPGRPPSSTNLLCACGTARCSHLASVLLVLAFNDPARRPSFELALWEVQLAPLVAGKPPSAAPEHGGEVRYVLEAPDPAGRLVIRPEVHRRSRSPLPYPSSRERLCALVPVDEADLAFHDAWSALETLRRRLRAAPERALTTALLDPLARCARVSFAGRAVTVRTGPLAPRLLSRVVAGDLALAWEPPLAVVWSEGFVLTASDELFRLAEHLTPAVRQRLADPLPVVPAADLDVFLARYAPALGVVLPAAFAPPPPPPESRLVLSEAGQTLEIRLETEGGDDDFRADARARFDREVGVSALAFGPALAWLRDVLPGLRDRWVVYGEDALAGLRVRGTLSPSVSFRSGEDGFSLDADFTVDGRSLPPLPVLESWLRGLRYHRLDDGTIAELPVAWLARHGRVLGDLAHAKRLGSWHAWEASELPLAVGSDPGWGSWVEAWRAGVPDLDPPAAVRATLRPYQRAGQSWLRFLAANGLHGLLADEMGLGKTLQTLAAVASSPGPSLIVAPTSVVGVWMDEIRRFTTLRSHLHHGASRSLDAVADVDVVVTTYGLLRRDPALRARRWTWLVLDEAQAIKQPGSKVARAARALRASHRVALTGTPLENDLTELWSLFSFLLPGYLGSRRAFHGRTAGPARRDVGAPAIAELRQRLRPFVLRRRKVEVAPELPARTVVVQPVPLSSTERALYERIRATWRASEGKLHRLAVLTRLRQACCHPGLLPFPEAREVLRSSKLRALLERLREAVAGGHKALVFSQWPTLLHRVAEALTAERIGYLILEGRTTGRSALVAKFQASDGPPVFLVSVKAGGSGLTLTAADVVIHLDPWWNPAVEDQATDRAHRIGQERPVTVYKLVAEHTVEDRVLALQERKRALFEAAVDADRAAPALEEADWEELLA